MTEQTTEDLEPAGTRVPAQTEPEGTRVPSGTEHEETPAGTVSGPSDEGHEDVEPDDKNGQKTSSVEPDTFPRAYVEKLRDEAARHRQRAAERDDLAQRLHTALVAATGRLHDPDDLPFEDAHLEDPEALTAAVDDLLARKPHLASRKPSGDVGQGHTGGQGSVDLAAMLRARA